MLLADSFPAPTFSVRQSIERDIGVQKSIHFAFHQFNGVIMLGFVGNILASWNKKRLQIRPLTEEYNLLGYDAV
jgi:hypothetical protein